MRRIATALGSLAAAAMFTLAVPPSADAASGALVLDGVPMLNPSGCYAGLTPMESVVLNETSAPVQIFRGDECEGAAVGVLRPGEEDVVPGGSVYVP